MPPIVGCNAGGENHRAAMCDTDFSLTNASVRVGSGGVAFIV